MLHKILPHFDLSNHDAYQSWRDEKLNIYPEVLSQLVVEISNPLQISAAEMAKIQHMLKLTNMVIYQWRQADMPEHEIKQAIRTMGEQFALKRLDHNECADEDAITALQVKNSGMATSYIPYSNKAINWHTDGYYNALDQQIYAFVLHCVRPAQDGGENQLLDPEMVYIQIRDKSPDLIRVLMQEDIMMIPKNTLDDKIIRPDRFGPVFMFDPHGQLHMRYTARKRNVVWKQGVLQTQAEKALRESMMSSNPFIFRGRLEAGQGVLSRNVLHTRDAFDEAGNSSRLLYRGRYYDAL